MEKIEDRFYEAVRLLQSKVKITLEDMGEFEKEVYIIFEKLNRQRERLEASRDRNVRIVKELKERIKNLEKKIKENEKSNNN